MKKRFFSLALALCMVLSLLPFGVSAAKIVDSGTCGENLTWTLDSDGLLTISGTGSMENNHYSSYYNSASGPFTDCYNITSVILEPGIKSIGNYAFY